MMASFHLRDQVIKGEKKLAAECFRTARVVGCVMRWSILVKGRYCVGRIGKGDNLADINCHAVAPCG